MISTQLTFLNYLEILTSLTTDRVYSHIVLILHIYLTTKYLVSVRLRLALVS